MKRNVRKRVFTAWFLLLTLMPLMMVKSLHCHHDNHDLTEAVADCCAQATTTLHDMHSHGGESDCPICQFILSPAVEMQVFHYHAFLTITSYMAPATVQRGCSQPTYTFGLRAPPVALI